MAKRSAPEVNAGSMADIAFLLLIFFLVTTDIAVDSGLSRKLPPWEPDDNSPPVVIKEKNIFALTLNSKNEILLTSGGDSELLAIKDLRERTTAFLDNGGGEGKDACKRCKGAKNPESSDNLDKAVVSLANDRLTDYKTYITVQNEILAAYNVIRNREFKNNYPNLKMDFVEATEMYQDKAIGPKVRESLKEKLDAIKLIVPQKFSEAEAKRN